MNLTNAPIIFIDAGHGGFDPQQQQYTTFGKRADHVGLTLHQKSMYFEGVGNRIAAHYLAAFCLESGIIPITIYHHFVDTPLSQRIKTVNDYYSTLNATQKKRACLVSLHSDAAASPKANGAAVFTTLEETKSDALATAIYEQFKVLPTIFKGFNLRSDFGDVTNDPDFESDFAIIKQTKCTAVLIERAFHTNRNDVQLLVNPAFNKAAMFAVAKAVYAFINT